MTVRLTPLVAALIGCGAMSGMAQAQSAPEFKFSGFGTVGVVHSSEHQADFVGNLYQPNGAGNTHGTSFGPDSKLGAQLSARIGEQWSAVLQLVSQHQYDNSWTPQVEWANVKYAFNSDLSLRLGRIALPTFLVSESRFVGYANPWVRPPVEVYGVMPITSSDGIDLSWRSRFGEVSNTVQAFYGSKTSKIPTGAAEAKVIWGATDSAEWGSLTLRANYTSTKLDLNARTLAPLISGLTQFAAGANAVQVPAYQAAGAQALALADKYRLDGLQVSLWTVGASYDPGQWFVSGEVAEFSGDGFLHDSSSWYLAAGCRFGSLTPFVALASTRSSIDAHQSIDTTGAPGLAASGATLNAGLDAAVHRLDNTQSTVSLGLRWDAARNLALKAQFDRTSIGDNALGRLANVQPGFVGGGHVNLISLTADFVY